MKSGSICEGWEGRTIDGKFPLLEWLGGWAEQCVFLTVRQGMQTANIKLIVAGGSDADGYQAKWEAARTLSHPHLAKVMESGQCSVDEQELVYVVTEKAEAVLSSIVPHKTITPSEMKTILEPIVDALSFLHEKGFVHGRVKPSNIVQVNDQWKLSVEELIGSGESAPANPGTGVYDAPEIASGSYSPAADVWSVGMIVVEAFASRTLEGAARRAELVPDWLPEPFGEIARRCLRTDPAERCSIAEVKTLLARDGFPTRVAPAPVAIEPVSRFAEVEPVTRFAEAEPVRTAHRETAPERPSVPPALPFDETEPIELTPRSRLFANMEEEEDEPRSRVVPILFGIILLLGAVAVFGVRQYRIKILSLGDVLKSPPATSQSSAPAQTAPNASAENQSTAPQAGSQPPAPNETQSAPAQLSTQPQTPPPSSMGGQSNPPPAESQSQTSSSQAQKAPAAPAPTPEDQAPASAPAATEPKEEAPAPKAARAVNAEGAVLKRVLPNVSPGASQGMRGPVQVEIRVWVNENGSVSNAEYMTLGPGNYFARVAREAARAWKFSPPETEGHRRASTWNLRFRFERRNVEVTATEIR